MKLWGTFGKTSFRDAEVLKAEKIFVKYYFPADLRELSNSTCILGAIYCIDEMPVNKSYIPLINRLLQCHEEHQGQLDPD